MKERRAAYSGEREWKAPYLATGFESTGEQGQAKMRKVAVAAAAVAGRVWGQERPVELRPCLFPFQMALAWSQAGKRFGRRWAEGVVVSWSAARERRGLFPFPSQLRQVEAAAAGVRW